MTERGHALPPGAAHAEAMVFRWRAANVGGVPKAGPPQVAAGTNPVLTSTNALPLRFTTHLARAARPLTPASLLVAWVAMRLLPLPTGVPKSTTGELAWTSIPLYLSLSADLAAALGLFDLITVFW